MLSPHYRHGSFTAAMTPFQCVTCGLYFYKTTFGNNWYDAIASRRPLLKLKQMVISVRQRVVLLGTYCSRGCLGDVELDCIVCSDLAARCCFLTSDGRNTGSVLCPLWSVDGMMWFCEIQNNPCYPLEQKEDSSFSGLSKCNTAERSPTSTTPPFASRLFVLDEETSQILDVVFVFTSRCFNFSCQWQSPAHFHFQVSTAWLLKAPGYIYVV